MMIESSRLLANVDFNTPDAQSAHRNSPSMTADPKPSPEALEAAREALRRGAKLDAPIPPCRCFVISSPRQVPRCNGVCEEAAEHVALALDHFRAAGVEAERSRVAEAINAVRDANTIKGRSYSACWMNACTEIETLLREDQP